MSRLEIIDRPLNLPVSKRYVEGGFQVSYNDWGHLALRFIDNDGDGDTLIVLSQDASDRLITFVKDRLVDSLSMPF